LSGVSHVVRGVRKNERDTVCRSLRHPLCLAWLDSVANIQIFHNLSQFNGKKVWPIYKKSVFGEEDTIL